MQNALAPIHHPLTQPRVISRLWRKRIIFLIGLMLMGATPAAHAFAIKIDGVEDKKIAKNINLHLQNFEVKGEQLTDPYWQQKLFEVIQKAVQAYGFYHSEATITEIDSEHANVTVTLNEPLRVGNVAREIIGGGRSDPVFRAKYDAFPLKKGDILDHQTYEKFKQEMFNYALSNGYFDFFWQATRIDIIRDQHVAHIALIAQSGERYKFGDTRLIGDQKSTAIIARLQTFSHGQFYDSTTLTDFNRNLNQTGYFNRVIARPIVSDAKDHVVPIEVSVFHKPRDEFDVGAGIATDTGPRVRLSWKRPWVNDLGHSVTGNLFLSAPEQSLTIDYRIPKLNTKTDYVSFTSGYQFIDYSNTDTESETLSFSANRYWQNTDSPWQVHGSVTYLREMYQQGLDSARTTQLILPGYGISYRQRDDLLNVTNGTLFQTSIQAGSVDLASDIDLIKATVDGAILRSFGPHRFRLRAQAGYIETNDFAQVPVSLRFFAGGDQSVRGFAYRDLSPREEVFNPVTGETVIDATGGRYMVSGGVEYDYPVYPDWRMALFVDSGTATNNFDEGFALGTGIGANWRSPIGPVRLYLARGFSDREDTWRLHFILGPEL